MSQIIEIIEDLFFIQRGYLNANHFVYRAEKPVLIDTGYVGGFDETRQLIEKTGVHLKDVHRIINTHTHCDHIGGNHRIQELSNCQVALHRIGRHFIESRDDWATWWRYFNQKADFFSCTQTLDDGDTVKTGRHEFQVIHTPGHASDGIVLYNPEHGILISADTLWANDMALLNPRVKGSAAPFNMLHSLKKIQKLKINIVFPSHGPPFENIGAAFKKTEDKIYRFLTDRQAIGKDLLKKIFTYTLLMHGEFSADRFFDHLMETIWFRETVEFYFKDRYFQTYQYILDTMNLPAAELRGIKRDKNLFQMEGDTVFPLPNHPLPRISPRSKTARNSLD